MSGNRLVGTIKAGGAGGDCTSVPLVGRKHYQIFALSRLVPAAGDRDGARYDASRHPRYAAAEAQRKRCGKMQHRCPPRSGHHCANNEFEPEPAPVAPIEETGAA